MAHLDRVCDSTIGHIEPNGLPATRIRRVRWHPKAADRQRDPRWQSARGYCPWSVERYLDANRLERNQSSHALAVRHAVDLHHLRLEPERVADRGDLRAHGVDSVGRHVEDERLLRCGEIEMTSDFGRIGSDDLKVDCRVRPLGELGITIFDLRRFRVRPHAQQSEVDDDQGPRRQHDLTKQFHRIGHHRCPLSPPLAEHHARLAQQSTAPAIPSTGPMSASI